MEHKQEECKFNNGEWCNEQPTVKSEPFVPHTAWTPDWSTYEGDDDMPYDPEDGSQ